MTQKKRMNYVFIILISIILVCIIIFSFKDHWAQHQYKTHTRHLRNHIFEINKKNNKYIDTLSAHINSIPVNTQMKNIIIQPLLEDDDGRNSYIWITDLEGTLIWGTPESAIQKLDDMYRANLEKIQEDAIFINKADFFTRLIPFLKREQSLGYGGFWRKNKRYARNNLPSGIEIWPHIHLINTEFKQSSYYYYSSPVRNDQGKLLGSVHMVYSDRENSWRYVKDKYNFKHEYDQNTFPILVIFRICFFLFWLFLPTWVYMDAQTRSVNRSWIWVVIVLLSNILGFLIYMLVRPVSLKILNCPQCDKELNGIRNYCPHCGFDCSSVFCQQCQYPVKPDWKFCPNCRMELADKEDKKKKEIEKR